IGAVGNNTVGVAGISQITRLLAIKILDASGTGTIADAIEGIEFAIQAKAAFASSGGANVRVINASWGGGQFSQALLDEIANAASNNILFVASAGNTGASNDVFPYYPAGYTASNVIAVAASDNTDYVPLWSNYGNASVPLAAPGDTILSTSP